MQQSDADVVEQTAKNTSLWPIYVVPGAMLIIALGDLPYGYYQVLRLVVCGASAYLAFLAFSAKRKSVCGELLVANAIVFNPIIPVYLSREIWSVLDIVSAVLLFSTGYIITRRMKSA